MFTTFILQICFGGGGSLPNLKLGRGLPIFFVFTNIRIMRGVYNISNYVGWEGSTKFRIMVLEGLQFVGVSQLKKTKKAKLFTSLSQVTFRTYFL